MQIKFGGIVTEGAGKVGGQIIQRGRAGQVMRNLSPPVIRKAVKNSQPRNVMASVSSSWRLLDSSDQDSWNALALTVTRYNKFGDSYVPTGYQLFCELNINHGFFNLQPVVETAPTLLPFPLVSDVHMTYDTGGPSAQMNWNITSVTGDWFAFVAQAPLMSLGASVPRGSYSFYSTGVNIYDEQLQFDDSFQNRFPFIQDGQYRIASRLVFVEQNTGQKSPVYDMVDLYTTT